MRLGSTPELSPADLSTLTITYFREQTSEEVELESKYTGADDTDGASIEDLRRQLDDVPFTHREARDR